MNRVSNRELQLPAFTPIQGEPAPPDVVRYLRTLNRYKWGILLVVIAVGMLAAMYASSLRPIYRSTATIMVEMGKPKVVSNQDIYESFGGSTRDYFLTQFEIVKSRELAERLVRTMQLIKHPEYAPNAQSKPWYADWVPAQFLPAAGPRQGTARRGSGGKCNVTGDGRRQPSADQEYPVVQVELRFA